MTATMQRQKVETITDRLFENIAKIRYGEVSAILRVHDGRIVDITHTVTESTRDREGGSKK